jgi:uncharacterized protein
MKEQSVENKLRILYSLQDVDSHLQEVEELKGDLPGIVATLDAEVSDLKARIKELNTTLKQAKIDREKADVEIINLAEKVEKYKSQQMNVKSNKQYDALTKEIEGAEATSIRLTNEMDSLETRMVTAKSDIDILNNQLEHSGGQLDDRKKELREVNKEHEKEELKLRHERDKLLARIDKTDLERYERIRKAKGGKAVVPVRRGACGGCFSRVPPQRILEIRQNARMHTCEHCGRILVSDHIVTTSVELK